MKGISTSASVSVSRREFLRDAGLVLGSTMLPSRLACTSSSSKRKAIVVTFGGGARDQETFAPEGQENIPQMLTEMAPQSSFFTHVSNQGILGHYVATASLATGVYETFNNFATVAPEHPTIFEYFRKELKRPATDAWVVAPSNGFNLLGESSYKSYGPSFGAGVILPKHLLAASISGSNPNYKNLLQDNYESPLYTPDLSGSEFHLNQLDRILKLSVYDFTAHALTLSSADELSVYIAHQLMRELAPSLLWITLHDMDVAHSGCFSLYLEGIRRSDRLCAEIWNTIQTEPEYEGKTSMFILPDFGRDSDTDAGGNGFQHHRTGDALSRTTWMMALGPGIREGITVDRRIESIDLVPTLGALLGCSAQAAQGHPLPEVV